VRRARLGLVTIGQTPRTDVVPEMAEVLGPGIEIVERGALDGLDIQAITALAPGPGDEVLVTRLRGGAPVFVAGGASPRASRRRSPTWTAPP
jgi:protein AroM